jgi:cobalt-zinc-cadmium efflux system protein
MTRTHYHPQQSGEQTRSSLRRMWLALALTIALVVVEAAAGLLSNSLALLTDAAHNLSDVIALALSWLALRLTLRPATSRRTFGYHRAGILVALVNSAGLVIIAIGIFYEAVQRFQDPPEVQSMTLIAVGALAFGVNLVTALLIRPGAENDLNMRSAFVHLMADVFSTLGAVAAGVAIAITSWYWLDPAVSVFIAVLILANAWGILRESVSILLESSPRDLDMGKMVEGMLGVRGVRGVHDVHVWSLSQQLRAASAHVVTDDIPISAASRILNEINQLLSEQHGIAHATLQLECPGCEPDLLYCDIGNGRVSSAGEAAQTELAPSDRERVGAD